MHELNNKDQLSLSINGKEIKNYLYNPKYTFFQKNISVRLNKMRRK